MDNNNKMDVQNNDKSDIVQFYSGKSILITGATGIDEITLKITCSLVENIYAHLILTPVVSSFFLLFFNGICYLF